VVSGALVVVSGWATSRVSTLVVSRTASVVVVVVLGAGVVVSSASVVVSGAEVDETSRSSVDNQKFNHLTRK